MDVLAEMTLNRNFYLLEMTVTLHARFDIVPREKTSNSFHDSFVPAIIVLFDNINDTVFLE